MTPDERRTAAEHYKKTGQRVQPAGTEPANELGPPPNESSGHLGQSSVDIRKAFALAGLFFGLGAAKLGWENGSFGFWFFVLFIAFLHAFDEVRKKGFVAYGSVVETIILALGITSVVYFVYFLTMSLVNWGWQGNPFFAIDAAVGRFTANIAGAARVVIELLMIVGLYGLWESRRQILSSGSEALAGLFKK